MPQKVTVTNRYPTPISLPIPFLHTLKGNKSKDFILSEADLTKMTMSPQMNTLQRKQLVGVFIHDEREPEVAPPLVVIPKPVVPPVMEALPLPDEPPVPNPDVPALLGSAPGPDAVDDDAVDAIVDTALVEAEPVVASEAPASEPEPVIVAPEEPAEEDKKKRKKRF